MAQLIARTWSRFLFVFVCIALLLIEPMIADGLDLPDGSWPRDALETGLWSLVLFAIALLAIRLLHILIWNGIVARRSGGPPPRLLTDLVDGAILVVTLILVIAFVFDKPVNGLIATSGVAVAIIGFALKTMISDLFSGIAITLERPFRLGDWIEIEKGPVGRVRTMSWRATGIELENGLHMVVPNGQLSEMVLRIYDRPERRWRDEIDVTLDYGVTEQQAERVLLSAAADVPDVASAGKPDVRIVSFEERGVIWRLRFWIPDYPSRSRLRDAVQRNLLRNMHFSGMALPVPQIYAQTKIATTQSRASAAATFIRRVPLFDMLTADELDALAAAAVLRLVKSGETVVRVGEEGASLYLVKEGLMEVRIDTGSGEETAIARLQAGQFFGEMSLLTGAPRTATVRAVTESTVIEVTKTAIEPILTARAELLETMSAVLAERQMQNQRAGKTAKAPVEIEEEGRNLARHLLGRMRAFFRIGAPGA
jgi:small-conductance mechanosensitive channel